jgi:RimJ/RimL family protein N-acetyltransferase
MSVDIDARALRGHLVRLEPLTEDHVPGLARAAEEDRSAYTYTMVPRAAETAAYVQAQLTRDGVTPFAQIRAADEAPVGCTTYCNPRTWPGRDDLWAIEIGGTWLAASAQRTGINAESKLLLMTYAFETLNVARADFRTDARNQPSRQAIERLGARFEGVLRNWGPSWVPGEEGKLRDSAIFSVIAVEWPQVKSALTFRIQRLGEQGLERYPGSCMSMPALAGPAGRYASKSKAGSTPT